MMVETRPFSEVLAAQMKASCETAAELTSCKETVKNIYALWVTLSVRQSNMIDSTLLNPFVAATYSSKEEAICGIDNLHKTLSQYCKSKNIQQVYTIRNVDILSFPLNIDFPEQDWCHII